MTRFIILMIVSIFAQACSSGGDYTKELSGGYFFRSEGQGMHDILCHFPGGKEIPADVISYDYNINFIIAAQKPSKYDIPLYEGIYQYKSGRDKIYYWLIVHKDKLIIGPMSGLEFKKAREKYHVPTSLRLKK